MAFSSPLALLLLLLILPLLAAIGRPGRGYGQRRERASLAIRLAIGLCLILAMAGFQIVRQSKELAVVFVVDVSDSMTSAASQSAREYIESALQSMGPEDQAAVVVFGNEALVERPLSPARELAPFTSIPNTTGTDLTKAIRLALALYPPESARRMVILSDGNITSQVNSLPYLASLADSNRVQILAEPFRPAIGAETILTDVQAPSRLRQGERFELRVTVETNQATRARVRVLAGGALVYERTHNLDRGLQSFSLPLAIDNVDASGGFLRYLVQIEPEADYYYQNNQLAAFSKIEGPPLVLVVSPPAGEELGRSGELRPDEAGALVEALRNANFIVETQPPGGVPADLVGLARYAALILVDTPARDLSLRQMQTIQSYVRDLGGGLVVVGGPTSYGVGGYYQTPLEETLPVEMVITNKERRPALTIIFIIDRSGSMTSASGGVTKLELAKEATLRSMEMLFPADRIGVIAFDDSAAWVVPITDLADPDPIANLIGSIRAGGGTDILAGLQAMADVLPKDPASLKHVILLTDGGADPTGIPELVTQLYEDYGITLTTVGVGQDAASFLPMLGELGGGRYHFAENPASIPTIFTEETNLATRAYIEEHEFYPTQASGSPILAGIRETPPLLGYVATAPKAFAQQILVTDLGDPLLSAWQYGLGRAVAFTSDASGRWAQEWVAWEGFGQFWAQVLAYTLGSQVETPLEVRIEHEDGQARVIVEAYTPSGETLNGYALQARLVDPRGQADGLDLTQTAPGRYEGVFTPQVEGAYLLGVSGQPPTNAPPGAPAVQEIAGWVLTYSPEYLHLEADPGLLCNLGANVEACLASSASGAWAAPPEEVFSHNLPAARATRPVWPWLLALAVILLPLDIGVRRLVLTTAEIRRGYTRLLQSAQNRIFRRRSGPVPEQSERMTALFKAKQRASRSDENAAPLSERQPPPGPVESAGPTPVQPEKTEKTRSPDASSSSTASSLLASKRERRKNVDE